MCRLLLLVLLHGSMMGNAAAQTVAGYPACRDFGYCSVVDVGVAFTGFPIGISPNVTRLDLTGHPISTLTGNELHLTRKLEIVKFTQATLRVVPESLFGQNTALREVYLNIFKWNAAPGVSTLPARLFENNTQLDTAVLSTSGLTTLPSRLLWACPKISTILIRGNALTQLPAPFFDGQRASSLYIDLSLNSLFTLPEAFLFGLAGRSSGAIEVNLDRNSLLAVPHRIPINIALRNIVTSPGIARGTCANLTRGMFDTNVQAGVVSNFCSYECTRCNETHYPSSECTYLRDTQCAPLPRACIEEGLCSALNLTDVPFSLLANVTSLDVSANHIFAVDKRALLRLPLLLPGSSNFTGNPLSLGCLPSHSFDDSIGACVHDCSLRDASHCTAFGEAYISENCTATLAPVCKNCSTTPCISSGQFTTSNCSVYTAKLCQPCRSVCPSSSYMASNCTEFTDSTCARCSSCSCQQFTEQGCTQFSDRVCGQCNDACSSCTGASNLDCVACQAGFVMVNLGSYGGSPGVNRCVAHEQCRYSDWGQWTVCSAICGGGRTSSTRSQLNVFPCLNSLETSRQLVCNSNSCDIPTMFIIMNITNISARLLSAVQIVSITRAVAFTLEVPVQNLTLISVNDQILIGSEGTLNSTNQTSTSTAGISLSLMAIFASNQQLVNTASFTATRLASSNFARVLSTIIGANVSVVVSITVLEVPSVPAGHLRAPDLVTAPVAVTVAFLMIIGLHATVYTLWFRYRSHLKLRYRSQVEARRSELVNLISQLRAEKLQALYRGLNLPQPGLHHLNTGSSRPSAATGSDAVASTAARGEGVEVRLRVADCEAHSVIPGNVSAPRTAAAGGPTRTRPVMPRLHSEIFDEGVGDLGLRSEVLQVSVRSVLATDNASAVTDSDSAPSTTRSHRLTHRALKAQGLAGGALSGRLTVRFQPVTDTIPGLCRSEDGESFPNPHLLQHEAVPMQNPLQEASAQPNEHAASTGATTLSASMLAALRLKVPALGLPASNAQRSARKADRLAALEPGVLAAKLQRQAERQVIKDALSPAEREERRAAKFERRAARLTARKTGPLPSL